MARIYRPEYQPGNVGAALGEAEARIRASGSPLDKVAWVDADGEEVVSIGLPAHSALMLAQDQEWNLRNGRIEISDLKLIKANGSELGPEAIRKGYR